MFQELPVILLGKKSPYSLAFLYSGYMFIQLILLSKYFV